MAITTTPSKKYSPAFKAQTVQELLKEEQTLTQFASKHGFHPGQLRHWYKPIKFLFEATKTRLTEHGPVR